jgi:hypothetical protein
MAVYLNSNESDPSEEFKELVLADVKSASHADAQHSLRSPEHINQWLYELRSLKRAVESQLSQNNSAFHLKALQAQQRQSSTDQDWVAYQTQHWSWRIKTARFLEAIEARLQEATHLQRTFRQHSSDRRR